MAAARTVLTEKRDDILRLAALRGAGQVRVFGSVARGEDGPGSDIDLLVVMDEGRSLIDLIGFWQDVTDLVGRKVDVVTGRGLNSHIRKRVLAEARPL